MRQKAYHYLSRVALTAVFFLICSSANGQDLIERTLKNVTLPASEPTKPIGKQIHSYRWPKSGISLFELHKSKKSNAYSEYTDEAVYLTIDQKKLSRSFKSNEDLVRFNVPVSASASFDLILESVEILAPDYKMETSDGRVIYPDRSNFKFYRGIIADDPNSIATVTIIGDKVRALISDDHGNYILGELPKEKGIFTLYNDKTLKKNLGEFCQVSDSDLPASIVQDQEKVSTDKSTTSPCVPIYVEADYKMYQDHGNSESNVEVFIASLLNEVATIYTNESISISLSSTFVWTSNDPYNMNNLSFAIQQFANQRMDNYDGRLAHLISGESGEGGLAWLDVLYSEYTTYCLYECAGQYEGFVFPCGYDPCGGPCGGYDPSCLSSVPVQETGPYAVSSGMSTSVTSYPTFSWEVEVFAHEMGHNFGSPHTHACAWGPNQNMTIDDCGNYYLVNNNVNDDPWEDGIIDDPNEAEGFGCWNPNNPDIPSSGTIMSYCHLTTSIDLAMGFGTEPGDLIRARYNSGPQNGISLECQTNTNPVCLEVFASNYNQAGPCVYDCTTTTTNTIDGTNVNASIITSQSSLQTMGTVIADPSNPIIWRANNSVELNPNFSIEINSSVTIDVGECEDN